MYFLSSPVWPNNHSHDTALIPAALWVELGVPHTVTCDQVRTSWCTYAVLQMISVPLSSFTKHGARDPEYAILTNLLSSHRGSRGKTHRYDLWLVHVVVWQKLMQYCKAIILQFKKKKWKKVYGHSIINSVSVQWFFPTRGGIAKSYLFWGDLMK